jgi:WhiB family redox-sensing transcriptional regulator
MIAVVEWQDFALCGDDPHLFFGPEGETAYAKFLREEQAKAVCGNCPVRLQCLGWALAGPLGDGIWAGLDAEELAAERRRRARAA